eukprot:6492784-Amphidinium_carterae.6
MPKKLWEELLSDDEVDVPSERSLEGPAEKRSRLEPSQASSEAAASHSVSGQGACKGCKALSHVSWVPRLHEAYASALAQRGKQTKCFKMVSACSGTGAPFIALKVRLASEMLLWLQEVPCVDDRQLLQSLGFPCSPWSSQRPGRFTSNPCIPQCFLTLSTAC